MADHRKFSLYGDEMRTGESHSAKEPSKDMYGLKYSPDGFESEDEPVGRGITRVKGGRGFEDNEPQDRRLVIHPAARESVPGCGQGRLSNNPWEQDLGDLARRREGASQKSLSEELLEQMERGRFAREGRRMPAGRGRWNAERGSPDSPRGRYRDERPNWGNHGGREQRRFRSPQGRRSRSHSPHRKRMRSRSSSRSRSRSGSDSPRNRRNYSRSTSRNRGHNVSGSRSKSPPGRQHIPGSGFPPQVHQTSSYHSYKEDPFRGPQPPGVDSPVARPQYAAPFAIPPPGVPPPQNHPSGPPPSYTGYESYYQHQPPPSMYPPGVPEYMASQTTAPTLSWSSMEYPPPEMKHNPVPAPVPVPVPVPQPDSSSLMVPPPPGTAEESNKKEAAIERELRNQKQNLVTQREEYIRKSKVFERDLGRLRAQEEELSSENSRDNERILLENHKLQVEIQNKLKAINNVIDMLTGIIGDSKEVALKMVNLELEKGGKRKQDSHSQSRSSGKARSRSESSSDSSSEDVKPNERAESISPEEEFQKYNFIHFDPENHWCRVCNVFPRTAKEYLHHLHSAEHKDQITSRKLIDMPWHKDHPAEEVPQVAGAPTKRTPIKGLQFFISAPAWYCKLCAVWMGDLHCASIHLKSKLHAIKYHNFIKENETWETNWLSDREQAYERLAEPKEEKNQVSGYSAVKEKKAESSDASGKDRSSRQERSEKVESKKKRTRSSSGSSSGSAERNQDIEATGGWVKDRVRVENDKERARRAKEKELARSRGREKDGHEQESETDKSKSIRVAMRNKESRFGNEKSEHGDSGSTSQPKSKWDSPDRKNGTSPRHQHGGRQNNAPEDRIMREWLPVEESENQLLSNLKDRVKRKHEDKDKETEPKEKKRFYPEPQFGRNKFSRDVTPPRHRRSRGGNEDSRWEGPGSGALRESPPPHRRMNDGKGRDRDRDRGDRDRDRGDRDRDRDRDRERDRDRDHDRRHPPERREEDDETHFEKQSGEYRKSGRKQQQQQQQASSASKSKLPFIGRMPVFKNFSKKDGNDKSKSDENSPPHSGSPGAAETSEVSTPVAGPDTVHKERPPVPTAAQINASIMEYRARVMEGTATTEDSLITAAPALTAVVAPMPKSTLILSKTPAVSIDNLMKNNKDSDMKMQLKKLSEQMQLMEKVQATPVPSSDDAVPMELEEEAESGPGLAKDFQDALDIIFPDPSKPPPEPKVDADGTALPDTTNPPPTLLAGMPNLSNPPPTMMGPPPMGLAAPGVAADTAVPNGGQASMAMDGSVQTAMGMAMYDGPPGTYPDMQSQALYPPGMGPMAPMGVPPMGPRMGMPPMGMPPMGMPPMGPPPMGMPMGPPPMGMPPMGGARPPAPAKTPGKTDLSADDMAMLGIDADDIGAQGM